MFTEYERLQADLVVLFGILHHLAEEGDVLALSRTETELDAADAAYFSNKIVQEVLAECE